MPREPNPIDDEDLFNSLELGGTNSPGIVKSITGHDRNITWDVKEGSGQKGASSTLKAVPLRVITVTFYLATEADIGGWPTFRALCLSTTSGKKPIALDVYHPDLSVVGISSVVLASMGGPVHDGRGGQTIAVQFQEYAPPKRKGGSVGKDPNAALNAELAALTKQYQATPWG